MSTSRNSDTEPSKRGNTRGLFIGLIKNNRTSASSGGSGSSDCASREGQSRLGAAAVQKSAETGQKYGAPNPSEFHSLKLESMVTMEEMKAVSESFSSLLEKEIQLSKEYSEIVPGCSGSSLESKSLESPEEEADTEQFFSKQIRFFGDMKQFLTSQNISLHQNLEVLVLKMNRTTPLRRSDSEVMKLGDNLGATGIVAEAKELEALRQSGSPISKNKNDFQICPVCGVEFELNETGDSLEEHVAGHWCSQEGPV